MKESTDKVANDPIVKRINSLNTDEIVKDILKGWYLLHTNYPEQIRKYQLSLQAQETCRQLARELYEKNSNSFSRVVWDEELFKNW
ncbi:MAG: hypothetical protein ACFFC7_04375 [Candidatus Hermodarchaeota archaeon]